MNNLFASYSLFSVNQISLHKVDIRRDVRLERMVYVSLSLSPSSRSHTARTISQNHLSLTAGLPISSSAPARFNRYRSSSAPHRPSPSSNRAEIVSLSGVGPFEAKNEVLRSNSRLQCKAVSKHYTKEYIHVLEKYGLPLIKWHEIVEDDREGVTTLRKIKEGVESIRSMFSLMDDGEISVSAYDTAWVALVQDINGSGAPQFPSSLEWIANNQLPDGSWGDRYIFLAHDRIINTLACVIALSSWNICPDKTQKGMSFIKENICKLEQENVEHMPIGFEVAFPSLIEIARKLDIEVPEDCPVLQEIYVQRNLKLTRIPKDVMHRVPTTLLHSLEGMPDLEWEKLLKLQSPDGSFLFSPSSTAFALMQTKDDNCLEYLTKVVQKFNGGVPNVYPVDLFEHIWVVDRLQRLGISRYFVSEINQCLDYVHRYWTEEGICWARNSRVHDIDDTAMGFRLLRLHGYEVSADVFRHFENGGEFFCFGGQSNQAITGMYNLYRASQVLIPGEEILDKAKNFSFKFLREKQSANELLDKWIITKDLPGEVGYTLDMPWYCSLPRVETRFYLEQYGGEDDVWIGKTLYRMPYVNNNTNLELAKLDYNNCQAMHLVEWNRIKKWYEKCNLGEYRVRERSPILLAYYLATSSIFEPERLKERIAWAKTTALMESIISYFERDDTSIEERRAFVHDFKNNASEQNYVNYESSRRTQGLVGTLIETLYQLSLEVLVTHGRDIHHSLFNAWLTWMLTWQENGDVYQGQAKLVVHTINLCASRWLPEELLSNHQYQRLCHITNTVCHQLRLFQFYKKDYSDRSNTFTSGITTMQIESSMQELVQLVVSDSPDGLHPDIKQTFLTVAKTFYYTAYCNTETINLHIAKVLFEKVL